MDGSVGDCGLRCRRENILACRSVASSVRSMLGPKSNDKFIIEEDGHVLITNDGCTALASMRVEQPAARLLVQLSRVMDIEAGDGTTSVVILASAILDMALDLLEKGFNIVRIVREFHQAAQLCAVHLESLQFTITSAQRDDLLLQIARTSLGSKVVSQVAHEELGRLSVAAINETKGDINQLKVVTVCEGSLTDSEIIPGMLLSFPEGLTIHTNNTVSTALLQFSLEKPESTVKQRFTAKTAEDIDRIFREEEQFIKSFVIAFKKMSAKAVIVCTGSMSIQPLPEAVIQLFQRAKISAFKIESTQDFQAIARGCGATPFVSYEQIFEPTAKSRLGCIHRLYLRNFSELLGKKLVIEFPRSADGVSSTVTTVILKGGTPAFLSEAERAFHDAMCVLRNTFRKPCFVLGGGVCELGLSSFLESTEDTANRFAWNPTRAFAQALRIIPMTLAQNSGLDGFRICERALSEHRAGRNTVGLDLESSQGEGIKDLSNSGIVEPLWNKQRQISMATEAAIAVLRIDQVLQGDFNIV
eukprot:GILK01004325.1.p1 GENE.GILK01004325.1~~GILK01004325.1.p1  ORF type:complete len:530 (-),score=99.88 GILK01004325.1:11-1600(-)